MPISKTETKVWKRRGVNKVAKASIVILTGLILCIGLSSVYALGIMTCASLF